MREGEKRRSEKMERGEGRWRGRERASISYTPIRHNIQSVESVADIWLETLSSPYYAAILLLSISTIVLLYFSLLPLFSYVTRHLFPLIIFTSHFALFTSHFSFFTSFIFLTSHSLPLLTANLRRSSSCPTGLKVPIVATGVTAALPEATTAATATNTAGMLLPNFQICTIAFGHQENTTLATTIETVTTDPQSLETHPNQYTHPPPTPNQSLAQITTKNTPGTLTMAMFKTTHDRLSSLQLPTV